MDSLILIGSSAILVIFAIILLIVMVSFDKKTKRIAAVLSNHRNAIRMIEKLVEKVDSENEIPDVVDSFKTIAKRLDELEDCMTRLAVYVDMKRLDNVGHSG